MGQIASRSQLRLSFLRWAIVLVPLVVLLGFLSSRIGGSSGNPWFAALEKPAIMPPDIAFGIAWAVLYALTGFALALIVHARGAPRRGAAIALFVVQLAMNLAWSPIFFAAHAVTIAFWWMLGLFVAAGFTTWLFFQVRSLAGLLMLPYLAWLAFAALLTWQVHALNPDAESLAPDGPSTQIRL